MDYTKDIRAYIALEQEILSQLDVDAINDCLNFLDETRLKKGRIYICGNGGSASDAEHIVGDQNRFCKIFAAVNDTLSDCADFTDVFQRASLSLDQMPDQLAQRLRMCRKCDFAGVLDAVRAGMRNCAIDADAFTIALSEHLFAVHIDQLIL